MVATTGLNQQSPVAGFQSEIKLIDRRGHPTNDPVLKVSYITHGDAEKGHLCLLGLCQHAESSAELNMMYEMTKHHVPGSTNPQP